MVGAVCEKDRIESKANVAERVERDKDWEGATSKGARPEPDFGPRLDLCPRLVYENSVIKWRGGWVGG